MIYLYGIMILYYKQGVKICYTHPSSATSNAPRINQDFISYALTYGYITSLTVKDISTDRCFIGVTDLSSTEGTNAPIWRYVWVRLLGEDTEGVLRKCGFSESSGVFDFNYPDALTDTVASINNDILISGSNPCYSEAAAKLILSLNCRQEKNERSGAGELWVKRTKEYMNANLHKQIRISDIARLLHIDRKYLRNLFVKHTGMSPEQYLISIRLHRAKELLASTESSVKIIALSVGYEDALGFSKLFKKHVGVSPSRYREADRG